MSAAYDVRPDVDRKAVPLTARRTQRSRSEATQGALVTAARGLFGQAGFAATNTSDLVATASVTRGALYHHFADKEALFAAVAMDVAIEISETATRAVQAMECSTWERLLAGLRTYLELVADRPEAQRILLIDGPAVLGWERWRRIQSDVVLPGTVLALHMLMGEGVIRDCDAAIMAPLILALLNDAALAIANAPDPRAARLPVSAALMQLVEGLTIGRGATP